MDERIEKIAEGLLNFDVRKDYLFREVCGFTFVFEKEEMWSHSQIASAEIKPIAIIYEENGQYYLAPIDVVDQIEEVVKEFVRKELQ